MDRRRDAVVALVATSAAAFTATLDNTVVAVALREMQADLGAGVTGLQAVVTAYTVALAALLLAGGALVDRLGPKRVFATGLVVFAAASAGCALAGSVDALVVWRVVQGVGAALLLPGGLALLAAAYPDPVARRRAVGIWAALAGVALVAGPVLGGELVAARGWPWVFWVNLPLCAVVAVLTALLPATPAPARRRLDLPGVVTSCAVLGLLTTAVVLAGRGWRPAVLVCLLGAVASAVLLAWAERRAPDPLLPAVLVRERWVLGANLGAFAASLALFLVLVFVGLFVQLVQERDAAETGRLLLPLPLALIAVAALTARWRAVAAPAVLGLVVGGAALLLLAWRLGEDVPASELHLLLGLLGAGIGLTTAPLVSAALTGAGEERAGLASASVSTARELGGVVAVGGLGSLAVARLSDRLTAALERGGVPEAARPEVLDGLLSARTADVRRVLLREIGLERTAALRPELNDVATSSFVSSTQLVLGIGGLLLLVAAAVCGRLLRARQR